jgi:hypothetical protein
MHPLHHPHLNFQPKKYIYPKHNNTIKLHSRSFITKKWRTMRGMSKKAAAVVEAAPKFKQPWQGFLSFGTIFILAYVSLQWFFHPVWGIFTRMTQMNAAIAFWASYLYDSQTAALILSINNPNYTLVYPLGYIVNWVSFFIFCIVWFITIGVLARSFTPSASRLRKQPWQGIIMMALSMIFAAITWYILGVVMKWGALDMILLGTIGFAIFPIWVTLFHYWPFATRPTMNPMVRGAIYAFISWVLTFLIRGIIVMLIWRNPIATVNTMYMAGNPLAPLSPTEPFDLFGSAFFAIIVGSTIMSQLNLFPNLAQPKRGLLNFILAIVIGLVLWGILAIVLGNATGSMLYELEIGTSNYPVIISFPYVAHSNITAFLVFPLITLLAGQYTFNMWPWTKYGAKASLMLVIAGFIIGAIVYYIIMVSPLNLATTITGANLVPAMGGTESLAITYLAMIPFLQHLIPLLAVAISTAFPGISLPAAMAFATGFVAKIVPVLGIAYTSFLVYFEGVAVTIGHAIMYTWVVTVMIFYLLVYEAFDHWPWK